MIYFIHYNSIAVEKLEFLVLYERLVTSDLWVLQNIKNTPKMALRAHKTINQEGNNTTSTSNI